MDQLINQSAGQGQGQAQGNAQGAQPSQIQVTVVVNLQASQVQFQISIDSEIPFTTFVDGIKQQIFAQRMQAQYEETIEYQLQGGGTILHTENRSLKALGFKANSVLIVRLKLKGGQ